MNGHTTFAYITFLFLFVPVISLYQAKGDHCSHCCSGPPGQPGMHGTPGLQGATGIEGPKGYRGDKGYTGERGSFGPKGDEGQKGDKGRRGLKGQCGSNGLDGPKGQQGRMGPMGPKGEKGIKGEKAVKTPKVAFFVTRTSRFGPVNQDTTIEFDKVFLNQGGGFDTRVSTHFKCSVNGTYMFNVHLLSQEGHDAFGMIMLNKQPQVPLHGDHRSGFGVASNSAIFHLVEGDLVSVRLNNGSAISNDSSTFSGYLIYND